MYKQITYNFIYEESNDRDLKKTGEITKYLCLDQLNHIPFPFSFFHFYIRENKSYKDTP